MSSVITPKPETEVIVARRRPTRSASPPKIAAPIGRPMRVVANTSEVRIAESPADIPAGWK
ncbi:hypothetical protein LWC35_07595 [Pseudonocardia kujensis]|nr:hypothetical protein [Pseudonocardia kujensis]MCE0762774.1 hypothetical protein [Pseudonocardia kujensis]